MPRYGLRDQDGCRARVLHLWRVLGISKERQLGRPGLLQTSDPADLDVAVAHQLAPELVRKINQFHGGALVPS